MSGRCRWLISGATKSLITSSRIDLKKAGKVRSIRRQHTLHTPYPSQNQLILRSSISTPWRRLHSDLLNLEYSTTSTRTNMKFPSLLPQTQTTISMPPHSRPTGAVPNHQTAPILRSRYEDAYTPRTFTFPFHTYSPSPSPPTPLTLVFLQKMDTCRPREGIPPTP